VGIYVAETLGAVSVSYRFADPDAFLNCDNPNCAAAWLTREGLVVWSLDARQPQNSRFTDRLLVACSPACLAAAKCARPSGTRWSEAMPAAAFLDALRGSLDLDPDTTPIGRFADVA
jgi:hypothetical protein